MKLFKNLFFKKVDEIETIKAKITKDRAKDIKDLKKINKKVKFIIKRSDVEVIIRNVNKIMKEV